MKTVLALIACLATATPALAEIKVQLLPPWTGDKIPAGQHCTLQGGNGSTPPMKVSGLPQGTAGILVEYDDKTYKPLSTKGGHGTLLYPAKAGTVTLPAVPGMTAKLPGGVRVYKKSRASGKFKSDGYLPPCSDGRNNKYTATLMPISAQGKVLDKVQVVIGRY